MSDKGVLILIQVGLMILQIGAATAAILVDPRFAALGPIIGGFQSKFPDPFKQ